MKKIFIIFTQTLPNGNEGELGVDENGKLYWNKRLILTQKKITLTWWVNLSIIITSFSTLIMAVFSILTYFYK